MPPLMQRVASPRFAFRLLHFMHQRSRDPHTCAPNRMSERNRAAVYVESVGIELKITIAGNYLRRKCFVKFDQIDLRQSELLSFK